jgi:triosephosphate isomerase
MQVRRPLIAGNWKMYKTNTEAVDAARALKERVADAADVDIMIAPTFTALAQVGAEIQGSNIFLGAQNMHWAPEGAYTGEIAADMLLSCECRYVILGHSERRQYFNESDQEINRKLRAALQAQLAPIFCIGETETQRDAGQTFSVLDKQVLNGLEGLVSGDLQTLTLAYEPVWAIGTGKTATAELAQEVHAYLRRRFAEQYDEGFAQRLRILYGGSVKPANVKELMAKPDLDGVLVGGASLDPESFSRLVHFNA